MGKKKAVRTVNDAIQEAQAGLREKNEATATANEEVTATVSLDNLRKEIEEKEAQLARLSNEVAALKEQAIEPIRSLAESLGFHLSRYVPTIGFADGDIGIDVTPAKPKAATPPNANKAAIADWLRANCSCPIEKSKLVEQFKASGLGQRLRLDAYEDVVTVSSDDIVTLKK